MTEQSRTSPADDEPLERVEGGSIDIYETIFQTVDDAVFLVDVQTDGETDTFTFLRSNASHQEFTGLAEEELQGKTPTELLGDRRGTAVAENYRECVAQAETIEYEERLEFPAGTTHWQTKLTPITETGNVTKIVGTAREITEQKERHRELERANRRFEAILRTMSTVVFLKDTDGQYHLMNQACRDLFGLDDEEDIVGMTDEQLFPEEQITEYRQDDQHVVETAETIETEESVPTADGVATYLTRKSPVYGPDGSVKGLCGVATDITDRQRRQEQLEQQESLLEAMTEASRDGLLVTDSNWDILHVNEQFADMWGLSSEEMIHDNGRQQLQDVLDRLEDPAWFADLIEQLYEQPEREHSTELSLEDGRVFHFYSTPVTDERRQYGRLWVYRDITERRRREREIQELKERLEFAVDGANLGVWDWNLQTDEVTFNDNWATMLGYAPEEIDSRLEEWERRVHPDDIGSVEVALDEHMAGETTFYDTEHRMKTADGDWQWIRDVGKIFERNEAGEPVRAVGIHVDIDDRKQIEQTLREQRDMFTQGPAVVFKWKDADGWPVEYVSENVEDVLGYTPDELTTGDVSYGEIIHAKDAARVTREVTANSGDTTDRFSHAPYRIMTADGEKRWVLDNTKNIRTDGEITHRLGYLVDITERIRTEQQLQSQRDSLEVLNKVVRHDVRNDLQLVALYTETLEQYVETDGSEYLQQVQSAAYDAIDITETAKDVTEVMLQSEADIEAINLQSVLLDEIRDVRANFETATITVDGTVPAVTVQADGMLESVFRNLLQNAVQHNDKQEPQLVVAVELDGDNVTVRVADNGPGVPEELQEQIFEEGQKGLESGGTGLGLYLVRTLTERYGGSVWIEDTDTEGAVFALSLPQGDNEGAGSWFH